MAQLVFTKGRESKPPQYSLGGFIYNGLVAQLQQAVRAQLFSTRICCNPIHVTKDQSHISILKKTSWVNRNMFISF